MRFDVTPSLFYGATVAAAVGLSLGLTLHGPWESHAGGPQLHLSSAAADELARPPSDDDSPIAAEPDVAIAEQEATVLDANLDTAYLTPAPLPVTRLKPDMFAPSPVTAAAAEAPERQDAEALLREPGAQVATADN